MDNTVLELKNITQAYGKQVVVKDLSLKLEKGQIGCLLGESGCGKTTVMRTIAGFEPLLKGEIHLNGELVSNSDWRLAPAKRRVGMVFQDYALFPHMTIFDNVAFGLRDLETSEKIIRVNEVLELVGLAGTRSKYPHEISGGQQQRIALARALAPRPELLLMDEPFSNLDVTLRERLSMEVRDILKEYGATALFVTHNQHEAFTVADEVGVMFDGNMLQWDIPHEIYHRPTCCYVADFVGEGVLLKGVVKDTETVETGLTTLKGEFNRSFDAGSAVRVLIRPEDVTHDDDSPVKAEVVHRTYRGPHVHYRLRLHNSDHVEALVPSHCDHEIGEWIGIRSDVRHIVLFPG